MTCAESRELLAALSDGEAHPGEAAESARHLGTCEDCKRFSEDLALVKKRLREWPDETIAGRPWAFSPTGSGTKATGRRVAAAAAILLAALAGFAAGRRSTATPAAPTARDAPVMVEDRRIVYPNRLEVHSEMIIRAADHAALKIP